MKAPLARWHLGIGLRWSHFMTQLRRELVKLSPTAEVEFFKTWETQERGALHLHALLRVTGVAITTDRLAQLWQSVGISHGFGREHDVQRIDLSDSRTIAKKAGYCASYCTKTTDALDDMPTLDRDGNWSTVGVRAWSSSARWGDTMASIRVSRSAFVMAGGLPSGCTTESGSGGAPGDGVALDLKTDIYAAGPLPPVKTVFFAG